MSDGGGIASHCASQSGAIADDEYVGGSRLLPHPPMPPLCALLPRASPGIPSEGGAPASSRKGFAFFF